MLFAVTGAETKRRGTQGLSNQRNPIVAVANTSIGTTAASSSIVESIKQHVATVTTTDPANYASMSFAQIPSILNSCRITRKMSA